jgi:hypothetical protein
MIVKFGFSVLLLLSLSRSAWTPGLPVFPVQTAISAPLNEFPRSSGLVMSDKGDRVRLARVIATVEGFYGHNTLPARLNNPGALVYAGQPGAVETEFDGLAAFDNPADGWKALENDIAAKARTGLDCEGIIRARRGPTTDLVLYLQLVESLLGNP